MAFSTYIDCFTFLRATTGLETSSLLGSKGRLSSAVVAGATSLPVTPTLQAAINMFDQITIFDGPNSETVQCEANTTWGMSMIPLLQPLEKGHAQYTAYCTDGPLGSLADQIAAASSWIEDQAQQSLFQQAYTETLQLPSLSASIDNQGMLNFSPLHSPIQSDSAITVQSNVADPIIYDPSQVIIDSEKNMVSVPWLSPVGASSGNTWSAYSSPPYSRQQNLFLQVTYIAGYNPIPRDINDCCILRASSILARRHNPDGAVDIQMGKRRLKFNAGQDIVNQLDQEAKNILLSNYKRKM